MKPQSPAILVLGPTAGGKTRLSIDLACALPEGGELICADSMQVYRGMDIGTAKPTPQEQARAPHHMIDVADPAEDGFSVDTWLAGAEQSLREIRARGRRPIFVGGTNLYVQAYLEGLFDGPEPDPDLRARLAVLAPEALRARLEEIDLPAAERIHRNDRKRTIRAIEVFELTGRRLSDLQQQWGAGPARADVRIIGLVWSVEVINRRINRRVGEMVDAGLVDEVRELKAAGRLGRQAREGLGYKQILDHLEGRCDLEEAIEQIKIRSRRYAKHQRTWLRRFRAHPGSEWIAADEISPQDLVNKALTGIALSPGEPTPDPVNPPRDATGSPGRP